MSYTINATSENNIVYGNKNQEDVAYFETIEGLLDLQLDVLSEEYAEEQKLDTQLEIMITLLSKVVNNQQEEIRLLRLMLEKSQQK